MATADHRSLLYRAVLCTLDGVARHVEIGILP